MSEAELCAELERIEKAATLRLLKVWRERPSDFFEAVGDIESLIDLREKICPASHASRD